MIQQALVFIKEVEIVTKVVTEGPFICRELLMHSLPYTGHASKEQSLERLREVFKEIKVNPLDITLDQLQGSLSKNFCGIGRGEKMRLVNKVLTHFPEATKKRRQKAKATVKVYQNSLLIGDLFRKYSKEFK